MVNTLQNPKRAQHLENCTNSSNDLHLNFNSPSYKKPIYSKIFFQIILIISFLIGLYFISVQNYLLFHGLAEVFSIVIAAGIFMVAWSSREFEYNQYFLLIGIAYLFVGGLDLIHTLGYSGMNIVVGYTANLPTQLWIAARYLESISLLAAIMFIGNKRKINSGLVFIVYVFIFSIILGSIFYFDVFPDCFIEGIGLTPFKVISEYIISFILAASAFMIYRKRWILSSKVSNLLIFSIIATISSEMAFTLYADPYGFFNMLGHFLKIISFYLIYIAIIDKGIKRPYELLAQSLKNTKDELSSSEEKYKSYIDNAPDGVFVADVSGKYLEVNDSLYSITGYTRDELLTMNITDFINKNQNSILLNKETSARDPVFPSGEFQFTHKDGGKGWLNVDIVRLDNGRYLGFTKDITKRKNAEMELLKLNEELEQKIKDRTSDIQKLLKHKDEFINQLGHDLKNPMGPLVNLLPILEKNEKDEKSKEMLHVINRNVKYMKNLISKTIQFAQLNSPSTEFNFSETNLFNEVQDIITLNKILLESNNVTIINNLSKDNEVNIDPFQIKEVFNNLITNAVKYSNGANVITIHDGAESKDLITISIRDSGIGMTKEQIEKIFDDFYKVDTSRHDFDSSGLGLSISKRIIEKHGGRIWAESEGLGMGSTFYFTLPKVQELMSEIDDFKE